MNSESPVPSRGQTILIVVSRFFTALCICLWVGGMAFFGIMAAPVLFHPEKSGIPRAPDTAIVAPQMVRAMLTRFGTVTTICGLVLVVAWLCDGALSRALRNPLWRIQGAVSLVCVALGLYLNMALLPATKASQATILPLIAREARGEALSPAQKAERAAFDAGHKSYQSLATLNLYLLLAILAILMARGAVAVSHNSPAARKMVN